jgi:DNA-directed RNA polymerase subunit beta'
LKKVLARSFDELWAAITAKFVNNIKDFWYESATISGLSISKEDMVSPESKEELLIEWWEKVKIIQKAHWNGFVTEDEKFNQSVAIWAGVKKSIEKDMKAWFTKRNHVFAYIDSGARWNWGNVTQLCWMKGLVASTSGKTIELPIKSTLKEWFSTLEYFIATHGWRKGKADTALKTAQSGYLTRRLVDSSQNLIIKQNDCKSVHYKTVKASDCQWNFSESFNEKIYSQTVATDVKNIKWDIIIEDWTVINKDILKIVDSEEITEINIRSVLTCESEGWVCQKCYGLDLGLNIPVEIGTPVWVIAAQSIWEPGTQLTMRTFHSGWVATEGWDMTQGLSRVEELLEARVPKAIAEISDIAWIVEINNIEKTTIVKVTATELVTDEYYYSEKFEVAVKVWQEVKAKQIIARNKAEKQRLTTKFGGRITKVENGIIEIVDSEPRVYEYSFDLGTTILVKDWEQIIKGQKLTVWNLSLQKLMEVSGVVATEQYIVDDIKAIYASQWQTVNSKHIEIVIRQMFSRVRVLDKWDWEFFPGDVVDIIKFKNRNDQLIREGKKPGIAERLLLWITKISLFTESWLSAASFQETVRVLVESSVSWKIDKLEQMKENVIIGRLIPAWKEYRRKHWFEDEIVVEEEYFDSKAEEVDVSEAHMEEILKEMESESDF